VKKLLPDIKECSQNTSTSNKIRHLHTGDGRSAQAPDIRFHAAVTVASE